MTVKVCKFGGSSLADSRQLRKVLKIVNDDPSRRYIVPSAPGKRSKSDQKVTDLLYLCHDHARQKIAFDEVFDRVRRRYLEIAGDLKLDIDIGGHLDAVAEDIARGATHPGDTGASHDTKHARAYAASRGEYLCGLLTADMIGATFIDAAEVVHFDEEGVLDSDRTQAALSHELARHERAVVPGFYGSMPDGRIQTFSRGGSDISGALVARGASADLYENWTDVCGLLMSDPSVVENPRTIDVLTYRELRELAYMGATVLHDEAIFPARQAGIHVNIRNTNEPEAPGTTIVPHANAPEGPTQISGIAGRRDFTVIALEKALMNREIGFGRRLLGVLESHGISYEHTPTGIDTMSVVLADAELEGKTEAVLDDIHRVCQPDSLEIHPHMALIATVGRGMAQQPGMAAKLFEALATDKVNIRMIDQGSSEMNIIVGVAASDFDRALRAIYRAFVS